MGALGGRGQEGGHPRGTPGQDRRGPEDGQTHPLTEPVQGEPAGSGRETGALSGGQRPAEGADQSSGATTLASDQLRMTAVSEMKRTPQPGAQRAAASCRQSSTSRDTVSA